MMSRISMGRHEISLATMPDLSLSIAIISTLPRENVVLRHPPPCISDLFFRQTYARGVSFPVARGTFLVADDKLSSSPHSAPAIVPGAANLRH